MKRLTVRLSDELGEKIEELCNERMWSENKAAGWLISQYFSKPVEVIAPASTEVAVAKKKAPTKRFDRPSLLEVQQEFEVKGSYTCLDDGASFFDYYESNGWKVGKNSMKNWKAAVSQWHKRNQEGNNHGKNQPKAISGRDAITFDTTDF